LPGRATEAQADSALGESGVAETRRHDAGHSRSYCEVVIPDLVVARERKPAVEVRAQRQENLIIEASHSRTVIAVFGSPQRPA